MAKSNMQNLWDPSILEQYCVATCHLKIAILVPPQIIGLFQQRIALFEIFFVWQRLKSTILN